MNKQKKYLKKIWCLLLAVSLVMSMTPAMAFAEDGENTAASTATVTFTSQADNAFLHGPQLDTAVSSDLAESYGYQDSVTDGVSALDVLVKAHQVKYGEAFTADNASDTLAVNEDGSISKFFGKETDKAGVVINARILSGTVGNTKVVNGDRLEFFVYQDAAQKDNYLGFSKSYTTSGSNPWTKVLSAPFIAGQSKSLYLFGYAVSESGGLSDAELLTKTRGINGLQLGIVDPQTGAITPIEGAVSDGSYSIAKMTLPEKKNYYITAYVPKDEIAQGQTPAIMPLLEAAGAEAPRLDSLEIYENQTAYTNGEKPFTITPELTEGKLTGYSVVLPDYLNTVFLAAKFPGSDKIITGSSSYEGQTYTMMTRTNTMGYVWSSSGYSRAVWDKGYIDFYFNGDAGNNLSNYQIDVTQYTTLKSLEVEGVMGEAFKRTETTCSAYVDSSKEGTTITATPNSTGYTVTINGEEAENGEAFSLTYNWNDQGKMIVPIVVEGSNKQTITYTLTLEKMPREDTPYILTQPVGAEYTVLDTTVKALSVVASANGDMEYQWYKCSSEDKQDAQPISEATEAAYTPKNDTAETAYYFCRITNSETNKSADSELAEIIVHPDPTPVVTLETTVPEIEETEAPNGYEHPDDHGFIYSVGDEATPLTASYTLPVEGGKVTSERWYYSTSPTSTAGTSTSSMMNKTYTPGTAITDALNTGVWYHYTVQYQFNGKTYTAVSPNVYVYVYTDKALVPEISTQPKSAEYTVGDRVLALSVSAKYGTYLSASYQWYSNTTDSNTGGTAIEGATTNRYTPAATEAGTSYYYCVVTNTQQGLQESAASDVAVITVKEKEKVEIPLEGSGTEEDPYKITSQADLEAVANLVKEGYSFEGEYLKMTKSIDMDASWQGIGAINGANAANGANIRPFSGTFDGGGFTLNFAEGGKALLSYARKATVRDLNIYAPYMNDYALLSHYVVDYGEDGNYGTGTPATINVESVTIKEGSIIKNGGFLGGYASGVNTCTFANCTVEKNVKIGYNKTTGASSGLSSVGSFAGAINGTFISCVSYADVYGVDNVGGICGAKGQSMGPYSVSNSGFYGNIYATGSYVGGIAGTGYGSPSAPNSPCASIQNCAVAGNITGLNNVGGIYGGESAIYQNWGAAYIRDNSFCGTLTATGENANIGGIVGYMYSLNKYNIFNNNYYCADNVSKPIGAVKYVDTSSTTHEKVSGAEYINTSVELPGMTGISKKDHNRTDDPLGADSDTIGKKVTAEEMADGTVTDLLNGSESSYKNWTIVNGTPAHSSEPVAYKLTLSGSYQTEFNTGDRLTTDGMVITASYSDGTTKEIPASECK